jgi:hypothetical protein
MDIIFRARCKSEERLTSNLIKKGSVEDDERRLSGSSPYCASCLS